MKNPCSENHRNPLSHCPSTGFQSPSLTAKYFNWQSFFYFLRFLRTPLAWACGLWFNLFGILVFLISQPYRTRFQCNLNYLLHYAHSTSTAIFRLIRLCSFTPQHSLPSRVKDCIIHNSTVILCSNFNGRLDC